MFVFIGKALEKGLILYEKDFLVQEKHFKMKWKRFWEGQILLFENFGQGFWHF